MSNFNGQEMLTICTRWICDWFNQNGKDCKAVIGISGGKDSTVAAALCKRALGKDRVFGVLMPNRIQDDINIAREVVEFLDIPNITINIGEAVDSIYSAMKAMPDVFPKISKQTQENFPSRIRMSVLYAVAQSMNGRVCNTCNYSEEYVGYSTLWGDSAGDFAPLAHLTVRHVKELGWRLGLPAKFINKTPSDGLCGKSDEDNLGFTYDTLDDYILRGIEPVATDVLKNIENRHKNSEFKRMMINIPQIYKGMGV